jgi:glycosyltransferase involved in cell wall biosynthesis
MQHSAPHDLPLVSVVIPTYNRWAFLHEALDSVRSQTYGPIEIIVADDGSEDETSRLRNSGNLRVVRLSHSGRPGRVRNAGAREASGRYIAFLDSDDLWNPSKVEKQLGVLRQKEPFGIRTCHTREIWLRGDRVVSQSRQRHRRCGYIFSDALRKCIIGPSTVLLQRKLFFEIGMFDPDLEIAEDYELWLRLCARHQVAYIDEPLVVKRAGHGDQLSEKYGQIEIFRIRALLQNIERGVFDGEALVLAKQELARKCHLYARGCSKRGRLEEAARYRDLAGRVGA